MKSNTCFSKRNDEPLSVYLSREEAEHSAAYENNRNRELELVPYLCGKCGKYHLSPKDRQTPSKTCLCPDGEGNYKKLYETYEAAKRRADIRYSESEQKTKLYIYPCKYQFGYHLTKNNPQTKNKGVKYGMY